MKKLFLFVLVVATLCFSGSAWVGAEELGCMKMGGDLPGAPSYDWWYGCSATSAGMMMGYYAINGYQGLSYSNLVPGGAPATTFPITQQWGPSQAIQNIKNIITSKDFVTNFYRDKNGNPDYVDSGTGAAWYLNSGDDNPNPQGNYKNCLSWFMGTSQDFAGNANGSTSIYFWENGSKFTAAQAYSAGLSGKDGMLGMDLYFRNAGYGAGSISTDTNFFTQAIYGYKFPDGTIATNGFTYADYMADINAGLVVMIQLVGHSVFGYGYNNTGGQQTVYFYDTWDPNQQSMTWDGVWDSMDMWAVTCFTPTGGGNVPLPGGLLLLGSGLLGLGGLRRFRKS
jgi:hypothetical protein